MDKEPHRARQVKMPAGKNKQSKSSNRKHPHMKGKCHRCGSTTHKLSKGNLDKSSNLEKCSKLGHLAKVCLSAKANAVTSVDHS